MARRSKRSLAALKGWRTRRANELKRSKAAKKGWRTRRKAEAKQKKQVIDSFNDWQDMDVSGDLFDVEIIANADY